MNAHRDMNDSFFLLESPYARPYSTTPLNLILSLYIANIA